MWIVRLALRRPYTVLVACWRSFCLRDCQSGSSSATCCPTSTSPSSSSSGISPGYPPTTWNGGWSSLQSARSRPPSAESSGWSRSRCSASASCASSSSRGPTSAPPSRRSTQSATRSCACCRPGSQPPNILQFNASNVQVAQLTIKSDSLTEQDLFDYGLNFLRLRLFTIPGLSTPAPFGGRTRQVQVDLDPQKMQARGVSAQDVVNSLLTNNVILPAGQARIGDTEYDVLLNSSPMEVSEFNTMPLKVVNGVTVLLGRRRPRARRLRGADQHRARQRPARDLSRDPAQGGRVDAGGGRRGSPGAAVGHGDRAERRPAEPGLRSVDVRARGDRQRAARGGDRRGAGVGDDPVLPGQLAPGGDRLLRRSRSRCCSGSSAFF